MPLVVDVSCIHISEPGRAVSVPKRKKALSRCQLIISQIVGDVGEVGTGHLGCALQYQADLGCQQGGLCPVHILC